MRLWTLFFAAISAGIVSAASADSPYPTRPIRMIVPFSAAGPADFIVKTRFTSTDSIISPQGQLMTSAATTYFNAEMKRLINLLRASTSSRRNRHWT